MADRKYLKTTENGQQYYAYRGSSGCGGNNGYKS